MKHNIFLLMLVLLTIISLTSAETQIQTLGTFKKDSTVTLLQTCSNCTYVNITYVTYPNSSFALLGEYNMTQTGIKYSYDFSYTSLLGDYIYCGHANPTGADEPFCVDFEITKTGSVLSTAQGILYMIFLFILIAAFILCLIGAIGIPWSNSRNTEGKIIGLNDLKYAKLALIVACYLCLMFISAITRSIIENFTFIEGYSNVMNWVYYLLLAFMWPTIIVAVLLGVVSFLKDQKIDKMLKRGLSVK